MALRITRSVLRGAAGGGGGGGRGTDRSDSASARLLSQQYAHTKRWKHVDPHRAMGLKAQVLRSLDDLKRKKMHVGPRTYASAMSVLGRIGLLETVEELWLEAARFRGRKAAVGAAAAQQRAAEVKAPARANANAVAAAAHGAAAAKPVKGQPQSWMDRPTAGVDTMYNALLAARLRDAPADAVAKVSADLMSHMKRERVFPDQFTFNTILKGHARHGAIQDCWNVLGRMQGMKIHPDIVSYNTVLGAARTQDALRMVMGKLQKSGLRPNTQSYTACISVYTRLDQPAAAEAWLKKAMAEGHAVPHQCVDVMRCYQRVGAGGDVERLLKDVLLEGKAEVEGARRGGGFNAEREREDQILEGFHLAMLAYGENARGLDDVCRLYREVAERELPTTYRTYHVFVDAIAAAITRGEAAAPAARQMCLRLAEAAISTALQKSACDSLKPFEALARVYHALGEHRKLLTLVERHRAQHKLPQSYILEDLLASTAARSPPRDKPRGKDKRRPQS